MAITQVGVVEVLKENNPIVIQQEPPTGRVIEVLKGQPGKDGLQNVFVGVTPPENPQENTIWVDIS